MLQPPLMKCEGALNASLSDFYDALRHNSRELIRRTGDLIKMEDEANRVLQQTPITETVESTTISSSSSSPLLLSSSMGFPVPTTVLFRGTMTHLNNSLLSLKGRLEEVAFAECDGLQSLLVLVKLLAWYCFATARPADGADSENPSYVSSGRTTPMQRMPRRQNKSNNNININNNNNSANNNNNSNNNIGGVDNGYPGVETQLAEETFRLAVNVIVRLSCYMPVQKQRKEDDNMTMDRNNHVEICTELRKSVLYLLTAALMRFRSTPFNTMRYLPALFPEVDARDPQTIHPLLTPLFWDPEESVRAAAAVLLSSLLRKLQRSFQYAEEPQQKRQSFSSLASQSGRVLVSLHDALLWAVEFPSNVSGVHHDNSSINNSVLASKGLVLSIFTVLVTCTPYHRCPHAFHVLQHTFKLPLLCDALLNDNSEEFVPTTAFLTQVFKEDSLVNMLLNQFSCKKEKDDKHTKDSKETCEEEPDIGKMLLLDPLLTHASHRVEVWRCVVQLSRIHPSIVAARFTTLMETSRELLNTLQKMKDDHNTIIAGTAGDTLGECLRAWLHFMGYVWQSFDGHSADPALRHDHSAHRATLEQKKIIISNLVIPTLLLTANGCYYHDARRTALRCLAQVGEEYMSSLTMEECEKIVEQVMRSTTAHEKSLRAEAFTTIGVWVWQYNTFHKWFPEFVDRAVDALCNDTEAEVRCKAAFALSNLTSRLDASDTDGMSDEDNNNQNNQNSNQNNHNHNSPNPLRNSPEHMQLLCDVAMHAAQTHGDAVVMGHGIRMMSHLLRSLTFEELISELAEQQVGVAEGFLTTLLRFLLPSNRDAKLRWNAACAIGRGLARRVVFDAEPQESTRAVERLCVLICHDRIFKVRTQAAMALAALFTPALTAGRYAAEDLTPKVTRSLCEALRICVVGAVESYGQYREQDSLRMALRQALQVMITTAAASAELQGIFAEYRQLLETERLL